MFPILPIYHFYCSSFLPEEPSFWLASLTFYLQKFFKFFFEFRSTKDITFRLLYLKRPLFHFCSSRIFSLGIGLWVEFFFFQHFKDVIPQSSCSHCFWWEVTYIYIVTAVCMMSHFSLAAFKLFFIFRFQTFNADVLKCGFLPVILLGICWAS